MKYYIFKDNKQLKIMDTYPQRGIKEDWDIIPVPDEKDIYVNFKMYSKNKDFLGVEDSDSLDKINVLYGTITSINECFYHFVKPNKPDYDGIFQIESLPKLYINKTFVMTEEQIKECE
jgi:hypothetical protein